ncbi:hypothetical protein AB0K51_19185 [Kitasatospora sp. NPDC049285]|uniref:hypothetical protein n=1 Tax=Kitasatospora sp. NPDC049285 TaxID=3157096 RepID=UPI003443AB9A
MSIALTVATALATRAADLAQRQSPSAFTIGIDFDQVIHDDFDGWREGAIYGPPIHGAIEALDRLLRAGWSLFVMTARHPRQHEAIAQWLRQRLDWEVIVDDQDPERAYWHGPELLVSSRKFGALAYIDDKGLTFHSWETVLDGLPDRPDTSAWASGTEAAPAAADTTVPDWFADADAAYCQQRVDQDVDTYTALRHQADQINALLDKLGVTPVRRAEVGRGLFLVPALLLEAAEDGDGNEVQATWDSGFEHVALAVREAEDLPNGTARIVGALCDLADIAKARYAPAPPARPDAGMDPLAIALAALARRVDPDCLSADAHAVTTALHGLTAAIVLATGSAGTRV